jgi:XTP/dITP diphosphohydrolase
MRAMMGDAGVVVRSLEDYPHLPEIVEDGTSFLENALKKARTTAKLTGEIVLADDSGLEVAALSGAPGIYSSRYAGAGADDGQNNRKLLNDLRGVPTIKRGAAFRCVLVLCRPDGSYESFEGRWAGKITEEPAGEGGFGYDPVFFLPDQGVTVAELSPAVKNRIGHRAQAFAKLRAWFLEHDQENGA